MVKWSHGQMVTWSNVHMVKWSNVHVVKWSHVQMVTWSNDLTGAYFLFRLISFHLFVSSYYTCTRNPKRNN